MFLTISDDEGSIVNDTWNTWSEHKTRKISATRWRKVLFLIKPFCDESAIESTIKVTYLGYTTKLHTLSFIKLSSRTIYRVPSRHVMHTFLLSMYLPGKYNHKCLLRFYFRIKIESLIPGKGMLLCKLYAKFPIESSARNSLDFYGKHL